MTEEKTKPKVILFSKEWFEFKTKEIGKYVITWVVIIWVATLLIRPLLPAINAGFDSLNSTISRTYNYLDWFFNTEYGAGFLTAFALMVMFLCVSYFLKRRIYGWKI